MKVSKKQYGAVIGFVILLMILHVAGALKPIEFIVSSIVNPVETPLYAGSNNSSNWGTFFSDKNALELEISDLRVELQQLRSQIIETDALAHENTELRSALDYQTQSNNETILASIMGKEITAGVTTLIINRGTRDNIHEGDLVTTKSGELLGEIVKSNLNHAFVRLITHPDSALAVSKSTSPAPIGILKGNLSVSLSLELIPSDAEIVAGDLIVTNSIGNRPKGLLIGKIVDVEQNTGDLFQNATVEPFFNLDETTIVHIVKLSIE